MWNARYIPDLFLARQDIIIISLSNISIIISFSNISRAGKYNALCDEYAQYSKVCVNSYEIFVFSKMFRPALGPTQPRSQWVAVTYFPGVKRPGCEVRFARLILVQ
jgi:hypothetical protein